MLSDAEVLKNEGIVEFEKKADKLRLGSNGNQHGKLTVTDYEDEMRIQTLLDENDMEISSTQLRGARLVSKFYRAAETERSESDLLPENEYNQQEELDGASAYKEQPVAPAINKATTSAR